MVIYVMVYGLNCYKVESMNYFKDFKVEMIKWLGRIYKDGLIVWKFTIQKHC